MCPSYRGFSGSWLQLTAEYRVSADNWRPTTTATATKTSLKKWSCAASNLIALILHLIQFVNSWQFFLELNSKTQWSKQKKKKKVAALCSRPPQTKKREIRNFHFVVMQWRQRNVQKRGRVVVGFAKLKPFAFLPFSLMSPSSFLKLGERKQKRILENMVYRHESS